MIYTDKYGLTIGATDRREDMIKAGSAKYLDGYSKEQIDKGIDFIREMKHNLDSNYLKLDIDVCIAAVMDANRSTAAHKALPAPEGRRMDKGEALSLFAAMRANTGLEPAAPKPKRIDTTAVESELVSRSTIDRRDGKDG